MQQFLKHIVSLLDVLFLLLAVLFFSCNQKKPGNASINTLIAENETLRSDSILVDTAAYNHPYLIKANEIELRDGMDFAQPYYKTALLLFQKEKDWEGYVISSNKLIQNFLEIRSFDSAKFYLEKSWKIANSNLDTLGLTFATSQYLWAIYYDFLEEPFKSIRIHEEALNKRIAILGNDHLEIANSWRSIGDVYYYGLNDYESAENLYEKAINIQSKYLDEDNEKFINGYYSIARAKRKTEDTEGAIIYAKRALDIALINDDHKNIGLCYNTLANSYGDKLQFDLAEKNYRLAITSVLKNVPNQNYYLAAYYNGLAMAEMGRKRFLIAQQHLEKSRALYEKSINPNKSQGLNIMINMAQSFVNLEQFESAISYYNQCLSFANRTFGEKSAQTAMVQEHLGDLYSKMDDFDSALKHYQAALIALISDYNETDIFNSPEFSADYSDFRIFSVISQKANALKELYNRNDDVHYLKAALNNYILSDLFLGFHRKGNISDESFFNLTENYFVNRVENGIECAYLLFKITEEDQYLEKALGLLERSKSMVLFESLKKDNKREAIGIPQELAKEEKDLQVQMAFFKNKVLSIDANDSQQQQALQDFQTRIFETARKQEELFDKLKVQYPNYFQIKYDSALITLTEIQQKLAKDDVHLVEYFYGENSIYALYISSQYKRLYKIDKPANFESNMDTFLQEVSNTKGIVDKERFSLFITSGYLMYQTLIASIAELESVIKTGKKPNVLIIPDKNLSQIPFGPMISKFPTEESINYKSLDYLIKSANISLAYSANLQFKVGNNKKFSGDPRMLAFSYGSSTGTENASIIGSTREVKEISNIVNSASYEGKSATENNFKQQAGQFDILHLAVHGESDTTNLLDNILHFQTEEDSVEDGILHAYELYNLDISAKLVVLSACETGIGKKVKGEGIYSMARGFAYAGCPSIIMSYWKVNDKVTADIMKIFYQQLSAGETIDNSLTQAKLDYILTADEFSAHPSSWAAFIPLGTTNTTVYEKQSAITWPLILVLIAITCTLGMFWLVSRKKKQFRISQPH